MKKTRRRYDREFKISVVAELEAGKPLAQIALEYGVYTSLHAGWRDELAEVHIAEAQVVEKIGIIRRPAWMNFKACSKGSINRR
jgi:transposase